MKYEPPDYRKLYEEQNELINRLHNEKMVLYESLRDRFAMAIIPALMAQYTTLYGGVFNGLMKEVFELADQAMKAREEKPNE